LDPYLSAGVLHDIGKLVIASADPLSYRRILDVSSSTGTRPWLVEREILGCSHAEVGAYLLGIWGLPASIVEAVAWHHHPSESPVAEFSPLAAVHAANILHAEWYPEHTHESPGMDQVFLERLGLTERQEIWMNACIE
jgi:HD-like signal output (HDOD) protein